MASDEHLVILRQGVEVWNSWRSKNDKIIPYLFEANLSGANLNEADLERANLSGANLSEADLYGTHLSEADLSEVSFINTVFANSDLRDVKGLKSAVHDGPSTIGIDTIFQSNGKIPHKFLQDAGVPEVFIEYMGSMTGQAIKFYSSFISHSTKDKEFADRLHADLRKEGIRCWFAPEDMKGGKKVHHQIMDAINYYDKLLLVLSEASINSDWVAYEIKKAREREKQTRKQKLFPVSLIDYNILRSWELFDTDTVTDLAAEVRSYYIPDFTNWKNHDEYMTEFKRLVRDLNNNE